jgi:cell division protein FtsB
MRECRNHHHACDCREARFAALEVQMAELKRENARLVHENRMLRGDVDLLRALVPEKGPTT